MLAYDYPLVGIFLTMVFIGFWVILIGLIVWALLDLIRNPNFGWPGEGAVDHPRDHRPLPRGHRLRGGARAQAVQGRPLRGLSAARRSVGGDPIGDEVRER